MSTDESSVAKAEKSEAKPGKKLKESAGTSPGATSASNQPPELDEAKIDAPSHQELVMLGVICVATLILWAAGRAACNYQVPGESLTPRKVSLEERTQTPKDVGIEFAQSLSGGDFATASSLARGEAAELVKKEKNECGECASRKKVAKKLLSIGTVLKANVIDTIVSVRTIGAGPETVRVFGIEREGRKWFVSRIYASAKEAQLKEPPLSSLAPPGIAAPEDEAAAAPATSADSKPGETAAPSPAPTSQGPTSGSPTASTKTPSAPTANAKTPGAPAPGAAAPSTAVPAPSTKAQSAPAQSAPAPSAPAPK